MNNKVGIKLFKDLTKKEIVSRVTFFIVILTVFFVSVPCLLNTIKMVNKPFPGFFLNARLVVSGIAQYHWTGSKAELKFPDKILTANGKIISSKNDLQEEVNRTSTGDTITYSFERKGQTIELQIPTMLFTWGDFFMAYGISFLTGITFLLIGVVVYILKPDTKVSYAFLLASFFLSVTNIISYNTILWGLRRLYFFVSIFLPASLVHLSLYFPEDRRFIQRYPYLQFAPYIISAIFFILLESFYPGPLFAKIQKYLVIYIILSAFALFTSTLYSFFKKSSVLSRQRAKVVLLGTALAFPIPALALFMSFTGIKFLGLRVLNNFLIVPLMIFPASIAYAIAKHNLFDVDVYIKRAVGYGLMTAIVGSVYFSIQLVIRNVLTRSFFLQPHK
jgi:hypothetical protein